MITSSSDTDDSVCIKPETIEIYDLGQFVKYLTAWHSHKVKILEHMLSIPEDSEMVVDGGSASSVIMTGDMLAGFKAGVELALIELGTMPFGYELEDTPVETNES